MNFEINADKDTLGQRIRKQMAIRRLTKADLSKETGIPATTISYLVDGSTYNPRIATLVAITNFLGVSLDELVGSQPIKSVTKITENKNKIPLLQWQNVKYWLEQGNEFLKEDHLEWVSSQQKLSAKSFALKVPYQTQGIFPKNSIIIIDPCNEWIPSDYVLSSMRGNYPTIRKVFKENTKVYLNAIGFNLTAEEVNDENQILGKIIENQIFFTQQE